MPDPEYRDPSLPVERRVDDLLARMTLEEKAAQLGSIHASDLIEDGELDREAAEAALADGIGHVTRFGGDAGLGPAAAAERANEVQSLLEGTRLGVPAIPHEECLSGYMGPGGTTFPQAIGLAATWSAPLVESVTAAIRDQLRAIGCVHALSPVLDVARDLRWGRVEETFGEDPYLVARMACAYVSGLQGGNPADGVSATLKHFAGHGATAGGKNRASANLGERELREVHLFPFEAAVREAGAESVMNAYHDVDGVPCARSERLLTGVLREEWGFGGTVVADYGSVAYLRDEHRVARDDREAAVMALEAGIDVELPATDCYDELADAVEEGDLAEGTLDAAVRRVLRTKVRKGLLDDPYADPSAVPGTFDTEGQRRLARRAARASVTLLENDGVLPLDDGSLAVVGPKADSEAGLLGDYAYGAHYPDSDPGEAPPIVTPLEALGDRAEVAHAEGCTVSGPSREGFDDAVATAADADAAVAFVGARSAVEFGDADASKRERPGVPTSGEGNDVTDLGLPGVQADLVRELAGTDTPLVVVLVSGKPHAVPEIAEAADALVHAWLPGEEGGNGIADVLLGEHAPGGRLPVSMPRSVGQLPVHYSRKRNTAEKEYVYTPSDPLYPFGHGLPYTEFEYGALEVDPGEVGPSGTVTAAVTVRNAGDRAAPEVVQCYASDRYASQARPVQELVGFERAFLDPGEEARVAFEIGAAQLAFHDGDMDLVVEPGAFELRVGRSAEDVRATGEFEVVGGRKQVPATGRRYFADTRVE